MNIGIFFGMLYRVATSMVDGICKAFGVVKLAFSDWLASLSMLSGERGGFRVGQITRCSNFYAVDYLS